MLVVRSVPSVSVFSTLLTPPGGPRDRSSPGGLLSEFGPRDRFRAGAEVPRLSWAHAGGGPRPVFSVPECPPAVLREPLRPSRGGTALATSPAVSVKPKAAHGFSTMRAISRDLRRSASVMRASSSSGPSSGSLKPKLAPAVSPGEKMVRLCRTCSPNRRRRRRRAASWRECPARSPSRPRPAVTAPDAVARASARSCASRRCSAMAANRRARSSREALRTWALSTRAAPSEAARSLRRHSCIARSLSRRSSALVANGAAALLAPSRCISRTHREQNQSSSGTERPRPTQKVCPPAPQRSQINRSPGSSPPPHSAHTSRSSPS